MNIDELNALRWFVYLTTCIVGGIMFLKSGHLSLKYYGSLYVVSLIYMIIALWFLSGVVVSGYCLGEKHNENTIASDEEEVRMTRFVYIYSIVTAVLVIVFCFSIMPEYWFHSGFCKLCFIICKLLMLGWIGCSAALLDQDPVLCNKF